MNRQNITVVTAETAEVVTLAEVKSFLRVTTSDEDTVIQSFLDAAIDETKNYTRRSLINRTLKLTLDRFPASNTNDWWDGVRQLPISELHRSSEKIELPSPPLVSVTSIVTYDTGNTASTFGSGNYTVDTANSRVLLNFGQVWPVDLRNLAAIEITYVSGYGAAASNVPASLKTAIMQHTMEMYEMRQFCEPPEICRNLLNRYRIRDGLGANV